MITDAAQAEQTRGAIREAVRRNDLMIGKMTCPCDDYRFFARGMTMADKTKVNKATALQALAEMHQQMEHLPAQGGAPQGAQAGLGTGFNIRTFLDNSRLVFAAVQSSVGTVDKIILEIDALRKQLGGGQ